MRFVQPRGYTVMQWRRRCAVQESRALRAYLRATGRLPVCTANDWRGWE